MTELQKIEQELKQNFGNSMEPYTLELLSRYMGLKGVGSSNSSSTNTFDFPADTSLDITQHKNHLVMNDGGVAKLVEYAPPIPGVKGKLSIEAVLPQKVQTAIYHLTLSRNLVDSQDSIRFYLSSSSSITMNASSAPSAVNEFLIGATIEDTIDNFVSAVNANPDLGTCWVFSKFNSTTIKMENLNIATNSPIVASQYQLPSHYNNSGGDDVIFLHNGSGREDIGVQIQVGIDGAYAHAYIDLVQNSYNQGKIFEIVTNANTYNINITDFISNSIAPTDSYMGWNMATTLDEFVDICVLAFNNQGYFTATKINSTTYEIEETNLQQSSSPYLNINKNYIPDQYVTILQNPQAGIGINLKHRILGFLIAIVDGQAKISTSHTNTGVLHPAIDVTYSDGVNWEEDGIQYLVTTNTILVPSPDGKLIDYPTLVGLGHDDDNLEDLLFLGQVFIALENKNQGEEILVRPISLLLQ